MERTKIFSNSAQAKVRMDIEFGFSSATIEQIRKIVDADQIRIYHDFTQPVKCELKQIQNVPKGNVQKKLTLCFIFNFLNTFWKKF